MTSQFMDQFNTSFPEEDQQRQYRAWRHLKNSRELRLQIRDAKRRRFTIPYASVQLVQFLGPSKLSILCNHCIIHITGENLDELDALLQDERARYIQAFNAKHFDPPAANEGKITEITIEWLRKGMEPEEDEEESEVNQAVE